MATDSSKKRKRFLGAYNDLRIFVEGVEVAVQNLLRLNVTYSGRGGVNSASFDLANPQNRFVWTEGNLRTGDWIIPNEDWKLNLYTHKAGQAEADSGDKKKAGEAGKKIYAIAKKYEKTIDLKYRAMEEETTTEGEIGIRNSLAQVTLKAQKEILQYTQSLPIDVRRNAFAEAKHLAEDNNRIWTLLDSTLANSLISTVKYARTNIVAVSSKGRSWIIGEPVFDPLDRVRIFQRDPSGKDQWKLVFTGFVKTSNVTTDDVTGDSTVTVSCEDIRGLMNNMRVQMNYLHNPNQGEDSLTVPEVLFTMPGSLYQDALITAAAGNSHPFSYLTLDNIIRALILGGDALPSDAPGVAEFRKSIGISPIGNFKKGIEILDIGVAFLRKSNEDKSWDELLKDYLKGAKKVGWALGVFDSIEKHGTAGNLGEKMQRWHYLANWGGYVFNTDAKKNAIYLPKSPQWYSEERMYKVGTGTMTGQHMDPVNMYLHMMIPDAIVDKKVIEFSFATGGESREWSSRLQILEEVLSAVDLQIIVSVDGSIMIEPPTYELVPEDIPGDVGRSLILDKEVQQHNLDIGGNITTVVIVEGEMALRQEAKPNQPKAVEPRGIYYSPDLIARYGVHVKTDRKPWLKDPDSLTTVAAMEFWQEVGNFENLGISIIGNLWVWPNRPVKYEGIKKVGWCSSVTHNWQEGSEWATQIQLAYIKSPRMEDGKYVFSTGGLIAPISYLSKDTYEGIPTAVARPNKGQRGMPHLHVTPARVSSSNWPRRVESSKSCTGWGSIIQMPGAGGNGKYKSQYVLTPNRGRFKEVPYVIVLHGTAGGAAKTSVDWLCRSDPRTHRASAHFVVPRHPEETPIYQLAPLDWYTWHAGKSSWKGREHVSRFSYGIEIANWGGGLKVRNGVPYRTKKITVERVCKYGGIWYEDYYDTQLEATFALVHYLLCYMKPLFQTKKMKRHPIYIVGHEHIAPGRKTDPWPPFPWSRLKSYISNTGLMKDLNIIIVGSDKECEEKLDGIKP